LDKWASQWHPFQECSLHPRALMERSEECSFLKVWFALLLRLLVSKTPYLVTICRFDCV
jgi:hypothetical protein